MITNCQTYNGAASTIVCTLCSSNTYISGNGTSCTTRVNSAITNCNIYSISLDQCDTCNVGFQLSSDGTKCFTAVANCMTYVSLSSSLTSLTCSVCMLTYYLNSSSLCILGGIVGCQTYSNSTTCSACNTAGYYLSSGTCVAHVNISNCLVYNSSTANICDQCAKGFHQFNYSSVCLPVTSVVNNCLNYTNTSTCGTCFTDYFSPISNTCISKASFPNCKTLASTTTCATCLDGFLLNSKLSSPNCVSPHMTIATNCWTWN